MVRTETGKILIKNNGIDFFQPKPDLYKLLFSCIINWIWITTEFLIDRTIVCYVNAKIPKATSSVLLFSFTVNTNKQVIHKDGS